MAVVVTVPMSEAGAAVRRSCPDVVIIAQELNGADRVAVVRRLMDGKPSARVVVLTPAMTADELLEVLRLGVAGIVLNEMEAHLLVECVRRVYAGEQWVERRLLTEAVDTLLRREAGAREVSRVLTPREIAIVRGVAEGLSNKDIADALYISEGTVKTHLHSAYQKLKITGRRELARYALDRGLTSLSAFQNAGATATHR